MKALALIALLAGSTVIRANAQAPAALDVTPDQMRLGNATRIAKALLRLAKRKQGRIAVTGSDYVAKLTPYFGNASVFTAPGEPAGTVSYQFNTALAGTEVKSLANPAQTVLVYCGRNGKLDFRFGGRALVGCADGEGRYVSKQDAAKLIWKP